MRTNERNTEHTRQILSIFSIRPHTRNSCIKNFNVNTLLLPRVVTFTRKSMLSFLVTPVRSQNTIFQIVFARKVNLLRNDNAKRRSIFF